MALHWCLDFWRNKLPPLVYRLSSRPEILGRPFGMVCGWASSQDLRVGQTQFQNQRVNGPAAWGPEQVCYPWSWLAVEGSLFFSSFLATPKWSRPANFLSVLGEVWQKQFSERLEKSGAHFIFYFLQQKLVVWGIFLRAMLCWLRRRMTQKNQYRFSYNFLFFPAYLFFLSF